ncbi:MAG: aminotransferase class V-fold PLP-dependent enzyme [Hyphomicrobium sp.]|nr:aminotransferase class V-fold PLP-dependent enzyme [Hyphomicrobium sp.]PPD06753.1 MAG: aminotransferase [Hyphomicrobium sp.]
MTTSRTYLDHNATQPLRADARAAMIAAMDRFGNPSSVHAEGRAARAIVETAREQVAALVNAKPGEVVFTSGATEANALAIGGRAWSAVLFGNAEHAAVLAPVRRLKAVQTELPCRADGVQDITGAEAWALQLPASETAAFASMGLANGETGVVQPVAELSAALAPFGVVVHCDAAQAAGRMPVDFGALGVALMSVSAHKMGGPKGVGALIVRDGTPLDALFVGGGQEKRRRAGTESVVAIAGFGAAAEAARRALDQVPAMAALRDGLEAAILRNVPGAIVIGAGVERLANTSLISMPGKTAETLVIKLDLAGFAVSAGAACSSGKVASSHVLEAMGVAPEIARGAVRVSLGPDTTAEDIERFVAAWIAATGTAALAA